MAEFEHNSDKFGYQSLDDLEGVQKALTSLGYTPGTIDGKDGPRTQAAVREFQTAANIGVDGIAGPVTKGAIVAELDAQAASATEETPTENV